MPHTHDIHGQLVRITTEDPAITIAVRDMLSGFPVAAETAAPDIDIHLSAVPTRGDVPFDASQAALVGEIPRRGGQGGGTLLRQGSRWILDFWSGGLLSLDLSAGRVEGWLVNPASQNISWSGSFILISVLEMLRTRGLYAVHCSALAMEDRGVLFIGPGGSGKTTACIAMTRAGWRCLSDDHPLLRIRDGGLQLLPFPGRLSVTNRTVGWFPELDAIQGGFRQDMVKRSFVLSDVAGYQPGQACRPSVLIFPRITECDTSVLEPLSKARALEELLPQALLVLDPQLAARQFQTMTALVKETPAYRLHFGEDVANLPELVAQVSLQAEKS